MIITWSRNHLVVFIDSKRCAEYYGEIYYESVNKSESSLCLDNKGWCEEQYGRLIFELHSDYCRIKSDFRSAQTVDNYRQIPSDICHSTVCRAARVMYYSFVCKMERIILAIAHQNQALASPVRWQRQGGHN